VATTGQEEFTLDTASELAAEEGGSKIEGKSPWALAGRRLRRNYIALAFLGVFILTLLVCLLAPLYSSHVSHLNSDTPNAGGHITVNGQRIPILSKGQSTFNENGTVDLTPGVSRSARNGARPAARISSVRTVSAATWAPGFSSAAATRS